MKKILFGITSLNFGGAERVLIDLANRLSRDYDITILTIYDKGELTKQLNSKIKVKSIFDRSFKEYSKIEVLFNSFKLMHSVELPDGYDVYISFLEGPITRLFAKELKNQKNERINKIKRIAWIHNDISKVFGKNIKARIKLIVDKKIYKKYDEIIFVSEENRKDFQKIYGNSVKTKVIRNYLDYSSVIKKANEPVIMPLDSNDINLVTVSRLVDQKAIDRFIKVHSQLEKNGLHSKVFVVGDGPNREQLQKQIEDLNETENFFLLGPKENPYPYIKNADYMCLLSYYEGYGMVLDEAKILGKRIIITDTAARESVEDYERADILQNTEKGILEGLTKILNRDISNGKDPNERSIEEIKKYYDEIIEKIESIIN